MIDYAAILKAHPAGVLATCDGGQPRTRVFQYLFADGNKVYFCTNSEKPVFAQLQANPNVSFCSYATDFNPVLSVNGKAVFVDDLALKARAFDEHPPLKGIYNAPDNPVFRLFYIDVSEVETFSYAEGSKRYKL
ncbi:MAG: pyridoxamine 5'-phosphate oxidase family protein [Clostridia bacterium]|nr:pyridoxamine 5'-phosphate oxidase family protein [Clostridia bacterium]